MSLLPFLVLVIIGLTLGVLLLSISQILGEKQKNPRPHDIYESGMDPVGNALKRYDIKYFLTGILFLLFDVEIVFLFPWALTYKDSANKELMIAEFLFFMAILLVGYLYVLFSKSLKWDD